ncbi:MAG: hypothetical protein SNJ53_08435 [Thermodesulfovibrionales bacterium]
MANTIQKKVFFRCTISCAEVCCSGATLLTLKDIQHVYKTFPITLGFWKYRPLTPLDEDFFREVGYAVGDFFVIGEFIGGNWRRKRCNGLGKDKRCVLQLKGLKPLQCRLIPFSAVFDESVQGKVIDYQRSNIFARCQGFAEDDNLVWENGRFVDMELKRDFDNYRHTLRLQRSLMVSVLKEIKGSSAYRDFIHGSHGILEVPVLESVFEDFLRLTSIGLENKNDYVVNQIRLLEEVRDVEKADVFSDAINIYKYIA